MNCPHCNVVFHDTSRDIVLGADAVGGWKLSQELCPNCNKFIFILVFGQPISNGGFAQYRGPYAYRIENVTEEKRLLVWPPSTGRPPCPKEVPEEIAEDYNEACLILTASPKASAAMSRRCLQNILRDPNAANAQQRDLADQIQYVLDSNTLPTYIAADIDAVRNIGNFAAHPMKSNATGSILPVEPSEAEWNLNVIEALFDFYYVQPAIAQSRRNALNTKLRSAGKLPMK